MSVGELLTATTVGTSTAAVWLAATPLATHRLFIDHRTLLSSINDFPTMPQETLLRQVLHAPLNRGIVDQSYERTESPIARLSWYRFE